MFITAGDLSGKHLTRKVRFKQFGLEKEVELAAIYTIGDDVYLTVSDPDIASGSIEDIPFKQEDRVEIVEYPMDIEPFDETDIEKLVVGQRITAVQEGEAGKILLSNGVELQFRNDYECCSWFSTNVVEGELVDNVITGVSVEENSEDGELQYVIHILSQNTVVSTLEVSGDPGTGFYLNGASLTVSEVSLREQITGTGNTFNLPFEIMRKDVEES